MIIMMMMMKMMMVMMSFSRGVFHQGLKGWLDIVLHSLVLLKQQLEGQGCKRMIIRMIKN